jgi:hypothetical protein
MANLYFENPEQLGGDNNFQAVFVRDEIPEYGDCPSDELPEGGYITGENSARAWLDKNNISVEKVFCIHSTVGNESYCIDTEYFHLRNYSPSQP